MSIYKWIEHDDSTWLITDNTFCYYPFSENGNDSTWNTTLSTQWTKSTLWYTFNFNGTAINFNKTLSWTRFCSFWFKWVSWNTASNNLQIWVVWKWSMCLNYSHTWSWWTNSVQANNNSTWYKYGTVYTLWQRWHLAYWYNWTEYYVYVNWVKHVITTWTAPWSSESESKFIWSQYTWSSYAYNFIISDFILDKADRESEIVAHFNATKSLYWL